jgi:hypothetical protein
LLCDRKFIETVPILGFRSVHRHLADHLCNPSSRLLFRLRHATMHFRSIPGGRDVGYRGLQLVVPSGHDIALVLVRPRPQSLLLLSGLGVHHVGPF